MNRQLVAAAAEALMEQEPAPTLEFSWRTVRVTYIVPFLVNVDEVPNGRGTWVVRAVPPKGADTGLKPDTRVKGLLSATVDAQRRKDLPSKQSPLSQLLLGGPILRALGRKPSGGPGQVIREEWQRVESFCPADVKDWSAERIHFQIGGTTRKFLIVSIDVEVGEGIQDFLTKSKDGRNTTDPGALSEILDAIQPEISLRGDGGLHAAAAGTKTDDLSDRFLVSTVTMAVPSGPGEPPSIRFLDHHKNWGATNQLKWSYFLATHQKHDRRLPPDSEAFANGGFVDQSGAYDVRVEPFGTSIVFTDDVPEAWWDQLQILNSRVNPFVELAVLSYWQHTCLEYFTEDLAKHAESATDSLTESLEALHKFGDAYFFFRNCVWFDSVPNQPVWTAYLRKLQENMGDREAFARLSADYEDWTNHLRTSVALEEEKRRALNEKKFRFYSAIAAGGGIAFALFTLLYEPATAEAVRSGWGMAGLLATALVIATVVTRRRKTAREKDDRDRAAMASGRWGSFGTQPRPPS